MAQVVAECLEFVSRVIVVDDASKDDTPARAREAGATVLTQRKHRGYSDSLRKGLAATTAPVVITLDADGEHDPAEIPSLAGSIEAGQADLVFGSPGKRLRWSEGVLSRLAGLRVPVRDSAAGYRAIRGDLARRLPIRGRCTCGLLALDAQRLGARLAEVPVRLRPLDKRRQGAWFHATQVWWVLRGLAGL